MIFTIDDVFKFKNKLNRYSLGLIRTKGSGKFLYSDYNYLVNEIVQNTYIIYFEKNINNFDSEEHVYNYLKRILYYKYKQNITNNYKFSKECDIYDLDLEKHPYEIPFYDKLDIFEIKLTDKENNIVKLLNSGYTQKEISKIYKVSTDSICNTVSYIRCKYHNIDKNKERILKIVKNSNKKINQFDLNNILIKQWDSGVEISEKLKLKTSAISNCCKNKRKTHGGYKWQYG